MVVTMTLCRRALSLRLLLAEQDSSCLSLTKQAANKGTPTKRQVSKRLVSKRQVYKMSSFKTSGFKFFKFDIRIKQIVQKLPSFLFKVKSVSLLLIMVIYGKKTSKIENKTQRSLCLQTWLQQNLWISTNHMYRIYTHGCFFSTGRFEDLAFCNPEVL